MERRRLRLASASTSFMNNDEKYYVDSSTYIHETGHLLGLDDYYSYNPNTIGKVYGADMMDGNLGDHHLYQKFFWGGLSLILLQNQVIIHLTFF